MAEEVSPKLRYWQLAKSQRPISVVHLRSTNAWLCDLTPGKSRVALVCQGLLRVMHLRCMVIMANVKLRRSFCQCEAVGICVSSEKRLLFLNSPFSTNFSTLNSQLTTNLRPPSASRAPPFRLENGKKLWKSFAIGSWLNIEIFSRLSTRGAKGILGLGRASRGGKKAGRRVSSCF
jgi:hypothetical protein